MENRKLNEIIVIIGVIFILGLLLHILFMLNTKLQFMNRKVSFVDNRINQVLSDISNKTINLDKKFIQIERELGLLSLNIIYGKIKPDGTIEYGTGFSAFKGRSGNYGIIFNVPFAEKPAVLVSIDDSFQPSGLIRALPSESADRIDISIFSDFNATTPADRGFSFVAIGKKK